MSSFSFDSNKLSFGEPRVLESGSGGKCKFYPNSYDGKRMRIITPKCFCWGLQKDQLNTQRVNYMIPLVMNTLKGEQTEKHKEFISTFEEVIKKCQEKFLKLRNVKKLGSCLHEKDGKTTIYAKVKYNESKKKFFTKFKKLKIKNRNEDKLLKPLDIEGERCEAIAVLCIESVYSSKTHTTLQVKVEDVAMNFESVEEESLLPEVELEEEEDDKF